MEFLSQNEVETAKMAHDFAEKLGPNTDSAQVIGLYGDLGAGKTTFMKYLAEHFGIKETIQSPTFVIMKKYKLRQANPPSHMSGFDHLIHIDAYRIEREEEMLNLDWEGIIKNSGNLVCVEWPEKIKNIMPKHTKISFEHVSENQRNISINF